MYKVLLVDDDSIIRVKLQNLIDWNTFDCEIVAEASNGQEALDYIESYRPQIVITDMDMPGMSGVELIRHLQVGFNYALGLTDDYSASKLDLNGRNRGWSITAAILF